MHNSWQTLVVSSIAAVSAVAGALIAVMGDACPPPSSVLVAKPASDRARERNVIPVAVGTRDVAAVPRHAVSDVVAVSDQLTIELVAPLQRSRRVPLVVTDTDESLVTVVRHEVRTDMSGRCLVPSTWREPTNPDSVACIDLGFPSSGAHALQIDAATETARLWSPPRGVLQVELREADGRLVRGHAATNVGVVGATPPSDRAHAVRVRQGTGSIMVEAANLQLEVTAKLGDGRKAGPLVVAGPAIDGECVVCTLQLPPRPMFSVRMCDAAGRLMMADAVELRMADSPVGLEVREASGSSGVVQFPAPVAIGPVGIRVLVVHARDRSGAWYSGELAARLDRHAAGALGDVLMMPSTPLVAGRCLDAKGEPCAGKRLLLFRERGAGDRARVFGDRQWQPVSVPMIETDPDGRFQIFGMPPRGRLQLRVAGRPDVRAACGVGDSDLLITVPPRVGRRGLLR